MRGACHVRPRRRAGRGATRARRSRSPTDAIIQLSATCICGSDLWPYRGTDAVADADPDGPRVRRHRRRGRRGRHHDQAGPVRGRLVLRLRQHLRDLPGRLSDVVRQPARSSAPQAAHKPSACGSRLPTAPWSPPPRSRPPTSSRTSWPPPMFSAPAGSAPSPPRSGPARPSPSSVMARLACARVLAAQQLGAERIIAMSRHEARQQLARDFGATDIVTERGDEGVERIKELTGGLGAHCVIEAVGTQEVDDAGHPLGPARRPRRLRRRHPRRQSRRRGPVHVPCAPARRPRARSAASCPT